MHIHIHNDPADGVPPITHAEWVAARPRLAAGPARLSLGSSAADYRAAAGEVEVLVGSPRGLRTLLPLDPARLKIVACTWAGLDLLAPFDWLPRGVLLLNASGVHGTKAGEYVLMALLMLANRMPVHVRNQQARTWHPLYGVSVSGRHVVIVGLGAIGGAAATRCRQLGMRVTGVRRSATAHPACERVVSTAELDAVLPAADYLVLATPLTAQTLDLVDRRRLSLLPAHAGVVNVGRGRTLDEEALCDLLETGRLGGAVIDVFRNEPLEPGHRAWSTPNLIVTPHMSSDDHTTENAVFLDLLIDNLNAWAAGRPMPNEFDTTSGTRARSA